MVLGAILAGFGIYFLRNLALILGEAGEVPPALAAWAPPFAAMGLSLGLLLHHVPDHGTHHRSEIATMLTMVSGSPPGTGLARFIAIRSGQDQP